MAKLYIFGIGGTGARVIKALTFLLGAGVKLENFDTVVPILIDPDIGNGDLNRTKEILRLYQEIRNNVKDPDDFFRTPIKTIGELNKNEPNKIEPSSVNFEFHLEGIDTTFGDYIGYNSLQQQDKWFISSLYNQNELDDDLNVGFKGRPNMGVIVLSQFRDSNDFNQFIASFEEGDGIFIINSIFGGTGAAGFPLLLKTLKNLEGGDKAPKIRKSPIGALTMLPYFQLERSEEEEERAIKDLSFDEKAKIAMEYYLRTIVKPKKIQTLYLIGSKEKGVEKYAEGEESQKNKANFIELAGALAIFDFAKYFKSYEETNAGTIKEFGIEQDDSIITFDSLSNEDRKLIMAPLSKYNLFVEYLKHGLKKAISKKVRWTWGGGKVRFLSLFVRKSPLTKEYFDSGEYKNQVEKYNNMFSEWLREMRDNKPQFSPFKEVKKDEPFEFVKNKPEITFKDIDRENAYNLKKIESPPDKKHTPLIKLFGITTEEVLRKNKVIE